MDCRIAVILPCYNESMTIEKVVKDYKRELPNCAVYVYDNNSTDGSGELAANAGAEVRRVIQQGKGFVVRRMFQDVDADVYVMADCDDTYPADEVHKLIAPIVLGSVDMVSGDRLSSTYMTENKRPCHNLGNVLVCKLIKWLWRCDIKDVMTGYRAFSRRFVKTCPILSGGFEIETEMTLHALDKRMSIMEIPIQYRDRPKGSMSKLNTMSDGFRVLKTIGNMFVFYKPLAFFGGLGVILSLAAVSLVCPVLSEYFRTGLVPRFPTFIFACFLLTSALLSFGLAVVLNAVRKQSAQEFELVLNGMSCR